MKKVTKAVIPAAGLGTRLLPATKALPKEMLTIVDKPSLQYIVEELVASGITDIVIITGRNKNSIEDHFDFSYELENTLKNEHKSELLDKVSHISTMANIYYVRQNMPLGLVSSKYLKTFPERRYLPKQAILEGASSIEGFSKKSSI